MINTPKERTAERVNHKIKVQQMNYLYYGDNFDILQEYIPDESVDLIYLNVPFERARRHREGKGELGESTALAPIEKNSDFRKWLRSYFPLLLYLTIIAC